MGRYTGNPLKQYCRCYLPWVGKKCMCEKYTQEILPNGDILETGPPEELGGIFYNGNTVYRKIIK